jgi:hypothetical protein
MIDPYRLRSRFVGVLWPAITLYPEGINLFRGR